MRISLLPVYTYTMEENLVQSRTDNAGFTAATTLRPSGSLDVLLQGEKSLSQKQNARVIYRCVYGIFSLKERTWNSALSV